MEPIKVKVSFYGWQTEIFGSGKGPVIVEELLAKKASVEILLNQLIDRYPSINGTIVDPKSGRLHDHVVIIVNGIVLDLVGGLQTSLNDGDMIYILPFITGG